MPKDQLAQTQFPFFEALEPSNSIRSRLGNATCRTRLEGWLRMVAARAPIWGKVDITAFCSTTGYSREHATRTLSLIRRQSTDLVFETKICQRRKNGPKRWGVIVAERSKLRFDGNSLFFSEEGRWLHNYTNLGHDREKIPPTTYQSAESLAPRSPLNPVSQATLAMGIVTDCPYRGLSKAHPSVMPEGAGRSICAFFRKASLPPSSASRPPCDNSSYRKGSFGTQPMDLNGAERGVVQRRTKTEAVARHRVSDRLRRKAFAILKPLECLHWDNCKVTFSPRTAFSYALGALSDGHEERRIIRCYERGLFVCHGLATDISASSGEIIYFNPSSTISKARKMLEADGLNVAQRIRIWYENRIEKPSIHPSFPQSISTRDHHYDPLLQGDSFFPSDPVELRQMILESLGCNSSNLATK